MRQTTFIYALHDSSGAVRYVGKADNVASRLKGHIAAAKAGDPTRKGQWISELLAIGETPTIHILEEVPIEQRQVKEREWIATMKAAGCNLTNTADVFPPPPRIVRRNLRFELFDDTIRRVLAIPQDEARAICERTAPSRPRAVESLKGKPPDRRRRRRRG